jgi:hypothetical protein
LQNNNEESEREDAGGRKDGSPGKERRRQRSQNTQRKSREREGEVKNKKMDHVLTGRMKNIILDNQEGNIRGGRGRERSVRSTGDLGMGGV